jgi:SAM-dependent methyltransferase
VEQSELRSAFQTVYQKQAWGKGSGPGSSPANTIEYRAFVERFLRANAIRTVTDLGCGDWQFSHLIDWGHTEYLGVDIVPELVVQIRTKFASPSIRFEEFTSIENLPGGDLLVSKEVLQHLPNETVAEYLGVIRRKYRFALITNSVGLATTANADIKPGGFRALRLQDAPFNAPGAIAFTYFPHTENMFFRNTVFLMIGST